MTAQVFVTTYSLYAAGRQFESDKTGFWVDVDLFDEEEVFEIFDEVDPEHVQDHELMFTDYEGFPEYYYSESGVNFAGIEEWEDLDNPEKAILETLLDNGYTHEQAMQAIENGGVYYYDGDFVEYCQEYYAESYFGFDANHPASFYIDWERFASDNESGHAVYDCDTGGIVVMMP
jgi:hypothetical protein